MNRRSFIVVGAIAVSVGMLVLANVLALRALDLLGISDAAFLGFVNAVGMLSISSATVGAVIVWRVPHNRVGRTLLVGAVLLETVFAAWPGAIAGALAAAAPEVVLGAIVWWANVALYVALFLLFPVVGLIFPDGRLPGPRWRLPFLAVSATLALGAILVTIAPAPQDLEPSIPNPFALRGIPAVVGELGVALSIFAIAAGFGMAVAAVATRFRRSRGAERAQVKWVLAALAFMAIAFPVSFLTDIGPAELVDLGSALVGALMPVSIGIAILRYRLYEIDRLISRTVSWALVTGVLAAVFAGLVVGLQAVFADITQGQTLAVAASTLVAFALFQPVRGRVQRAVDRRFDRARYDSERTAAAFAERLRDRVDLAGLEADVASTVRAALRPSAVGVWTRRRGQEGR